MFHDRMDAGKKLGAALLPYRSKAPIILGIPRGGAEVAFHVAQTLEADFNILVVRKLPFPDNLEAGFGAIAEGGARYFVPGARERLPKSLVERIILEQEAEVRRRVKILRGGHPLPVLRNRLVILVDDGIAMGSTTQAAIISCRNRGVDRVIVAAPVGSPDACKALKAVADDVVVLSMPTYFRAVAEFYEEWYDVPDWEVVEIMNSAAMCGMLATPVPERLANSVAAG